ncbi:MAG: DUF1080 domain-containing protein [Verrucomicrobiae bacterium]|nr:DUF1080 domain-containing protein [Verrucomicrobiae bacterium]
MLAAASGGLFLAAQAADLPQPKVIDPGPPGGIPSDAIVLFDGKDLSAWRDANGGPARWEVKDGMAVVNGTGSLFSKAEFGACQLHVEWASPEPAGKEGQGRGNSGVYLQGRYEIQVLDSYGSKTYPDGQAGALYSNFPPLVNACRPPTEWQSYDILFHPPLAGADGQIVPGSITVLHNGVVIQDHVPVKNSTTAAAFTGPVEKGPLVLQDHGCPVRYKRLWIRPLK